MNEIRTGEVIRASQVAIDSWITTTIKSKLLLNGEVKTTEVKVITENGEVFLIGRLSHTQADAATEVARNVRGVSKSGESYYLRDVKRDKTKGLHFL